jgi:tetratricopeptide (TPR) repeat protein
MAMFIQEIVLRFILEEYVPSVSGGILPIFSTTQYSILSPAHFLDILNEILLIAPVVPVLLILLFFIGRKKSAPSVLRIFLYFSAGFAFFLMLAIDPKIGYARDWDLFSAPAAVLGISIILIVLSKIDPAQLSKYSRTTICAFSFIILSAWILTNASEQRQLLRAEQLLSLGTRGVGYSTELLAYYYKYDASNSKKAMELLQAIPDAEKNARVYNKIAKTQIDQGMTAEALKSIRRGLELDSNFAELHKLAGVTLTRLGRTEEGLPHLIRACALKPDQSSVYHLLGNAYFRLDSIALAAWAFKKTAELNPEYALAYIEAGNMFRLLSQYDSAVVYIRKGLRRDPNIAEGYQLLDLIKKESAARINQ